MKYVSAIYLSNVHFSLEYNIHMFYKSAQLSKKKKIIVRCDKRDFLCSLFYVHVVTISHFVVLNCRMMGVW
jgi:hypothetical protein